jgi:hypothetical protein
VSYNYSDNALFMFQQPHNNIGMQNMQRFVEGRRLVHTNFTTGDHNEPGNDRYDGAVGLQGSASTSRPVSAATSTTAAARRRLALNQRLDSMSVRSASIDASGVQVPHPQYGAAVQMNAVSAPARRRTGAPTCSVAAFRTRTVNAGRRHAGRAAQAVLAFEGPVPDAYSLRAAQPMIGTGLLEAVPEADILARVRSHPGRRRRQGHGQLRVRSGNRRRAPRPLRLEGVQGDPAPPGRAALLLDMSRDLAGVPQPQLRHRPGRLRRRRRPAGISEATCNRSRTTWRCWPCRPSAASPAASRKAWRRSTS